MAAEAAAARREQGNESMSAGQYEAAVLHYSAALSHTPKDPALYSNRSFAFLRLRMPARALADADEAVKRRPDWPKAHFRRAEAFRVAGLHDEALKAYERAANLDPQDTHLQEQRILSVERARGQQRNALLIVCACGLVGLVLFALLALAPDSSETAAPSPRRGGSGIWGRLVTPALGTALGLVGGCTLLLLRRTCSQAA
uniref:Uncharacterized protein n=1 Tax=Chrysotila carterae TaxID=13221 RepID=A0A7S4B9W3_CHRCT